MILYKNVAIVGQPGQSHDKESASALSAEQLRQKRLAFLEKQESTSKESKQTEVTSQDKAAGILIIHYK